MSMANAAACFSRISAGDSSLDRKGDDWRDDVCLLSCFV